MMHIEVYSFKVLLGYLSIAPKCFYRSRCMFGFAPSSLVRRGRSRSSFDAETWQRSNDGLGTRCGDVE